MFDFGGVRLLIFPQGWGMRFHTGPPKLAYLKDDVCQLPFSSSPPYFSALVCHLSQIRRLLPIPLVHLKLTSPIVLAGFSKRIAQKKPTRLSCISEVLKTVPKTLNQSFKISNKTSNLTIPSPKHHGPTFSPTATCSTDSGEVLYCNSWHRCVALQQSSIIFLQSSLRWACQRI